MGRRPELAGPPQLYYGAAEARRYARSTRIAHIQAAMAARALELLALPRGEACLLLDLGCGSGASGRVLGDAGHAWVGMDISRDMLSVASQQSEDGEGATDDSAMYDSGSESDADPDSGDEMDVESESESDASQSDESASSGSGESECSPQAPLAELVLGDMGDGVPFRPGTFDGCISISALQWLCHSNAARESPQGRLRRLFSTLFGALARGARAVFQVYPQDAAQLDLMLGVAARCGFSGGLVVDYPHSARAKKFFLVLMTGGGALPAAISGVGSGASAAQGDSVAPVSRRTKRDIRRARKTETRKDWVLRKKERARSRGAATALDSRYTARKRRSGF